MSVVAQTPTQLQTATSEPSIQSQDNNDLPCIKKLETMITDLSNCDINTPVTDDEKTTIKNMIYGQVNTFGSTISWLARCLFYSYISVVCAYVFCVNELHVIWGSCLPLSDFNSLIVVEIQNN